MAWNTATQLAALKTLVEGLPGIGTVYIGVPESLSTRVCAYITMGGQETDDKRGGGLVECRPRYRVTFGYRVAGAEATAEIALADIVDAFKTAFYADRKDPTTVLRGQGLDLSAGEAPQYQTIAGMEFREYPVVVIAKQEANV